MFVVSIFNKYNIIMNLSCTITPNEVLVHHVCINIYIFTDY